MKILSRNYINIYQNDIIQENMSQGIIGLENRRYVIAQNICFSYVCRHFLRNIDKLMFLESHENMTRKKTTIIYCMKRMFMNSLNLLNRGREREVEREGDREKSLRNSYLDNKAVKRKIRKTTHCKYLPYYFINHIRDQ